jgi:hypothetical protein
MGLEHAMIDDATLLPYAPGDDGIARCIALPGADPASIRDITTAIRAALPGWEVDHHRNGGQGFLRCFRTADYRHVDLWPLADGWEMTCGSAPTLGEAIDRIRVLP